MVRINLLPGEIIAKRRFEGHFRTVALAGTLLLVVLLGAYSILMLQVNIKRGQLQDQQQQETELRAQAEAFRVFEEKESDLRVREEYAIEALKGRINWGRLANELSLVLPPDVWLFSLQCDETSGMSIGGLAIDNPEDVPDVGHKAVAKTLIRLADLEQVDNVWLNLSAKTEHEGQAAIEFVIETGVEVPGSEIMEQTSVPAPPESAQ